MRIAPIQQQKHQNFCAIIKVKGNLEYVSEKTINYWEELAKDAGRRKDIVFITIDEPRTIKPETFSEQGHFYDIGKRFIRDIKVDFRIGYRWFHENLSYDTYEDSNHWSLTNGIISNFLYNLDDYEQLVKHKKHKKHRNTKVMH